MPINCPAPCPIGHGSSQVLHVKSVARENYDAIEENQSVELAQILVLLVKSTQSGYQEARRKVV